MRQSSIKCKSGQAGYTLVEVAIALLVLSIILASLIPMYSLYTNYKRGVETVADQKRVESALASFKETRGRYPCPARADAAPGDVDYGVETACVGSTEAPGTCADGICYEESERDITIAGVTFKPRVERGTVPFRTLEIEESITYDGYNNRYSYAVTETLADASTFRVDRGGITVIDGAGATPNEVINPTHGVHYMLISHGPDGVGAYNLDGKQVIPCKGPMYDNDNCNTDSAHKTARYRLAPYSTVPIVDTDGAIASANPSAFSSGNTHFDDSVRFLGIGEQPGWELANDNTGSMHDGIDIKKVVIGGDVKITEADVALQVEGSVKLHDKSKTAVICDYAKTNCMDPVLIGAEDPNDPKRLHCATAGQVAKGVAGGLMNCEDMKYDGCAAGQIMYGVDAAGKALCRDPNATKCAATSKTLCSVAKGLPESKSGVSHTLTAGTTGIYSEVWKCDKKLWNLVSSSGACTCKAGSKTTGGSCGANMTGAAFTTVTTTCPSGSKTTTVDKSACVCKPSATDRTASCPANHTGSIVYTDTVTCVGNVPKTTTTVKSNTCACVVNTNTQQVACASGWDGLVNQEQKSLCPSGGWGPWTDKSNSCTCKTAYTQTKSCGAKFNNGAITETCTYNCSGGYKTAATISCAETTNTCSCDPVTTTTFKACDSGYTGNIKVTSKTTCPDNLTTVTEDKSACQEVVNTCTVTASGSALGSGKLTWQDGQVCSFTATNDPCSKIKSCSKPLGGGAYDTYACKCL